MQDGRAQQHLRITRCWYFIIVVIAILCPEGLLDHRGGGQTMNERVEKSIKITSMFVHKQHVPDATAFVIFLTPHLPKCRRKRKKGLKIRKTRIQQVFF